MNLQAHAIEYHADLYETARALELSPESFGADALRSVAELLYTTATRADALEDNAQFLEGCGIEPGEDIPDWVTLEAFLDSTFWSDWNAEHRDHLSFRDPARFDRLMDAAERGEDGSTHRERLDDMRQGVRDFARDTPLLPFNLDYLRLEIDKAEQWHELNGSLDES